MFFPVRRNENRHGRGRCRVVAGSAGRLEHPAQPTEPRGLINRVAVEQCNYDGNEDTIWRSVAEDPRSRAAKVTSSSPTENATTDATARVRASTRSYLLWYTEMPCYELHLLRRTAHARRSTVALLCEKTNQAVNSRSMGRTSLERAKELVRAIRKRTRAQARAGGFKTFGPGQGGGSFDRIMDFRRGLTPAEASSSQSFWTRGEGAMEPPAKGTGNAILPAGVPRAAVGKTLASVTSPPPIRAAPAYLSRSNKPKHEVRMSEQRGSSRSKRRRRCRRECTMSQQRPPVPPYDPFSPSPPRDHCSAPIRRATCRSGFMGRHGADRDAGAGAIRFAPNRRPALAGAPQATPARAEAPPGA